jgi:hypothetical protein
MSTLLPFRSNNFDAATLGVGSMPEIDDRRRKKIRNEEAFSWSCYMTVKIPKKEAFRVGLPAPRTGGSVSHAGILWPGPKDELGAADRRRPNGGGEELVVLQDRRHAYASVSCFTRWYRSDPGRT